MTKICGAALLERNPRFFVHDISLRQDGFGVILLVYGEQLGKEQNDE